MLPKDNRLKKKKDFEKMFKKGKRFQEDSLTLKTMKNDSGVIRFGFVISQKVSKRAVIRNKVRRKLQEIIRKRIKQIKMGTDNLIIVMPGLDKRNLKEIEITTDKLFKKARLI